MYDRNQAAYDFDHSIGMGNPSRGNQFMSDITWQNEKHGDSMTSKAANERRRQEVMRIMGLMPNVIGEDE